jgi:hypothetical protein
VNCCVVPLETVGFAGVTAMDCNVAAVTVSTSAGDVTLPWVAVMLLVPTLTPVARPPAAIVATAGVADAHVAVAVRFCVLLSVNVPVAVNCCVRPLAIDGLTGVTAIDFKVAAVTVSTSTGEVTPFKLAVMLLVPTATPVARPPDAPLVMVATEVVADVQVTVVVMFCVEASL